MQVKVKAPPSYKKGLHKTLDAIWINTQKNSSISYFSSCSDISKDLENFQISSYPQKLNFKVIQKDKTPEFLYSVLELTPLDNPKVYISVYTLRKANCLFNFNLKAPSKQVFDEEEPLFKKMIQDFNLL
ncbi:MAG: hypothetical protein GDA46_01955 [Bdellovibrionales bacterium]|nr:hypothetical protein [Bdellovibrionales bacterium]